MEAIEAPMGRSGGRLFVRATWLGALAVVVPTVLYYSMFWNRFLGIRSGDGEYGGGAAFLAGLWPYRDYFTASTPLNIFKSAALLATFGDRLVVLRAAAVVERVSMALLLFLWLKRMFRIQHAVFAAVATMVVSTAELSDPLCSYNHDAIFMAMISGYAASFAIDQGRNMRGLIAFSLIAGFFAGLSFATKQTVGLGATVIVPVAVGSILWRLGGFKRAVPWGLSFLTGWAVPAGMLLLWLAHLGILHAFLTMVFVKGPAAKAGHLSDFFLRALLIASYSPLPVILGVLALGLTLAALDRSWLGIGRDAGSREVDGGRLRAVLVVFALLVACVLAGVGLCYATRAGLPFHLGRTTTWIIYFAEFALCLIAIKSAVQCLLGRLTQRQAQIANCAAVSFSVAVMLWLSFPAIETILLPGLGLLLAAALDGMRKSGRILLYGAFGFVTAAATSSKMSMPFYFGWVGEPSVLSAGSTSTLPQLNGLVLPKATVDFVDGAVKIIRANSTPGDTIFTYPEMSIFYTLSDRRYPTATGSHNIDVVNDGFAKEEARRLLIARPAVVLYDRQKEAYLQLDEEVWRHGRRSGQREIIGAVESLIKGYRLAATYGEFQVYVR